MKSFEEIYTEDVKKWTMVNAERMKNIYDCLVMADSVNGAVYECGVCCGGSSLMISAALDGKKRFRMFDSFEGLPEVCEYDNHHKKGDFSNVRTEALGAMLKSRKNISIHKGWIPESFSGINETISFAHLDVDIYQSYKDCLEFIYPKLEINGIIICDDYGYATCLGAKKAINEFVAIVKDEITYGTTPVHNQFIIQKGWRNKDEIQNWR